MIRIVSLMTLPIICAAILALALSDAEGCAPVRRRDDRHTIHIAAESALIVWDPVKKIEHFIRSATFDTKSPDFGFLVPTPTQPILAEVNARVFHDLDAWIQPAIAERLSMKFEPMFCCMVGCKKAVSRAPDTKSVRILAEQKVGGFNATVVEADDTESLGKWITDHGYSSDPELQSWLAPYVAAKWKITAFKIMQDPKTGELATTKPVRMSFSTERPFFPYREPAEIEKPEVRRGARILRVHFISDARVDGKLGNNTTWHAKVPWSDQLDNERRQELARQTGIADTDLPAKAWLTTFEDHASPRPGKDEVYFDPASDRSPIRPPDRVEYNDVWMPIDVLLVGIVFVGYVGFRVLRGRARFSQD